MENLLVYKVSYFKDNSIWAITYYVGIICPILLTKGYYNKKSLTGHPILGLAVRMSVQCILNLHCDYKAI